LRGRILLIWLSVLAYTLIPETFYDALEYHLSLPNLYLLHGRIIPTPENSYSGSPGLPWMLYGWTLAFDSWASSPRCFTAASFSGWRPAASAFAGDSAAARRDSCPRRFFS